MSESELSEMATAMLVHGLVTIGVQATAQGSVLRVNGRTLEPSVKIDYVRPARDQIAVGAFVSCRIDGQPMSALASGSVGIDPTRDGAIRTSVSEWAAQYGWTIAMALQGDRPVATVAGFSAYAGPTGFRGEKPPALGGSAEMQARLLAQLEPVLKQEFASAKGAMHAVTLTMAVQPGGVQGECRLDGQVFPKILERAAQFDWPRTQAGYMFKQYYVLVPKL
jgi:Family of unknown function (DUF6348)